MSTGASFQQFEKELNRLVESFGKRLAELKQPGYAEAQLRDDFLNPFFRALGWDMENRAGLIQKEREVEIESATQVGGGRKRADYLLRTKYAIYDTLYPWYTRKQLAAFPIKPQDDKLVMLVDKLLGLMPKLRAATSESEKATLQNA